MDGLEAQYGGYFIKNIRKLAFFWKKNAQKLASFKKYCSSSPKWTQKMIINYLYF